MSWLPVVLFVLLLMVYWASYGCFALRDFAYSRLEELCDRKGDPERFREILTQQDRALLALELLNTAGLLGLTAFACNEIGPPAGTWYDVASILAKYVLCGAAVLLVADLIPWTMAQVGAEPYLYRFWPVIRSLMVVLKPLLVLVRQADRYAHRAHGRGEPEVDDASVIGEEIRTVVDEGRREGVLRPDAGVMIERVMELQHEDVGAIMTPRTDMACIHVDASLEEARQMLLESGHSRVPVIGDSTDDILGILYAKDLLKALEPRRKPGEAVPVLRDIIREHIYVPITTQISSLLELMKHQHVQIAIVHDEYGGVAGLATMEDILEEIVGEIEDEYDEDVIRQRIVRISDTIAETDGRVHLDDLNKRFEFNLPEDQEYDTIGGFVFSLLGHIPVVGESVAYDQVQLTVLSVDRRKVNRVRIERFAAPGDEPAGE